MRAVVRKSDVMSVFANRYCEHEPEKPHMLAPSRVMMTPRANALMNLTPLCLAWANVQQSSVVRVFPSARRGILGQELAKRRRLSTQGEIIMIQAPSIANSTREERAAYVDSKYHCISDCDMCGLCKVFRGADAEHAYDDYITGKRSYMDVSADYKQ